MYAPAIAKCLQENLFTSDLLPVSNKQMSNAYGGIDFCKEEAKTFAQLLLHWDHGMNNGRPIPFLWRHKFPLCCDGHVSKFPIQSLCYPCFGHLKSSGLITRLKCVTLVPRVSHLTTSWGERGETLVWAGHVLLWQLKTLGRKGKRIREGSSTIRQFVALSFVTATAINRDV